MIGTGNTVGQKIANYSGIPSATVEDHLLFDRPQEAAVTIGGGAGEQRVRDHWEYMDWLREQQARTVTVEVSDDVRGKVAIHIPAAMPVPEQVAAMAPPGRRPEIVADIVGDPLLMAALVMLIDEADQ